MSSGRSCFSGTDMSDAELDALRTALDKAAGGHRP